MAVSGNRAGAGSRIGSSSEIDSSSGTDTRFSARTGDCNVFSSGAGPFELELALVWSWGPSGHLSTGGARSCASGGSSPGADSRAHSSSTAGGRRCAGEALALHPLPTAAMAEMLHPSVGGFSDAGLGWAHHSVPGAFAQQGPLTACKARVMEPQKLSACSSVTWHLPLRSVGSITLVQ